MRTEQIAVVYSFGLHVGYLGVAASGLFCRDHDHELLFFFFCLGLSNVFQSQCRASASETGSPDPPPPYRLFLAHHPPCFCFSDLAVVCLVCVFSWLALLLLLLFVSVFVLSFLVVVVVVGCCCSCCSGWRSRHYLEPFPCAHEQKQKRGGIKNVTHHKHTQQTKYGCVYERAVSSSSVVGRIGIGTKNPSQKKGACCSPIRKFH